MNEKNTGDNERIPSDDPQLTIDHVNPHDAVVSRDGDDLLRSATDVEPVRTPEPVSMEDNRKKIEPTQKPDSRK
jgi:hypothetical protein